MRRIKKISGYTLDNVLLAVALVAILVGLAVPNLMPLITKTKASEAKLQLSHIANLQTQYQYINSRYSNDLSKIDFIAPITVKENGPANYQYEIIEASVTNFKARAQAVVDFDGDGILNTWEVTKTGKPEEVIPD